MYYELSDPSLIRFFRVPYDQVKIVKRIMWGACTVWGGTSGSTDAGFPECSLRAE